MHQRFYIRAYGCQMNIYEADIVREILGRQGYVEVSSENDADVVLLLTCSVREHAEQRALGRLQNLRGLKAQRPELILAVLGCMAQLRAQELANGWGADVVAGPDDYRYLPELIRDFRQYGTPQVANRLDAECYDDIIPQGRTEGVTGMVSIMRGCDNYCAYCIVPYVRGRERSKRHEAVLAEVQALIARGAKDITLVGQNVLAYRDRGLDFAGLLRLVDNAMGDRRLRFLTSHPRDLTQELIVQLAQRRSLCHQIHLPLQSGANRILAAMNRGYTRQEYAQKVALLRQAMPDIVLTTDVLVGFPGESDEDFEQTLDFIRQTEYDFAYMFRYSPRPGTKAAEMNPVVPDDVAGERLSRLIAVQNQITRKRSEALKGSTIEVLVEESSTEVTRARTRSNKVIVLNDPVPAGTILNVRITDIKGWTPIGETRRAG